PARRAALAARNDAARYRPRAARARSCGGHPVSVRLAADNVVHLEGRCPVDDADTLLQLLAADPARVVDWRACETLHTALVQILLAVRPVLHGPCRDPFLQQWIAP